MSEEISDDVLNILIATDNHLGFLEKDKIRGNDTFDTFEEILQIAVREQVDCILLGGDLFHEAKPSSYSVFKCTQLLKKYCLGDKPVEIEFLSDPVKNFGDKTNALVNYEDPNLNVSLPVFSIHGNHDDPTGQKQISAMHLLSSAGLINYFGQCKDLSKIDVTPIRLQKGNTKLALYGISHVKDDRLSRLFFDQKVTMWSSEDESDWFNMLVLHQNRPSNRGTKNFIPETVIPEFIDLVVWGHEHRCEINPVSTSHGVYISQPGSSVATSFCEGEAIQKHIGLLKIHKKRFILNPIELKTVRPFIFRDILLKTDYSDYEDTSAICSKAKRDVATEIEDMITSSQKIAHKDDLLPLIHLIVRYRDEKQLFSVLKFGQNYIDKVANPDFLLKFKQETQVKGAKVKSVLKKKSFIDDSDDDELDNEKFDNLEDVIKKHLNDNNIEMLLSLNALNDAVKRTVDSNDDEASSFWISYQEKKLLDKLAEVLPPEDEVEAFLGQIKEKRGQNDIRACYDENRRNHRKTANNNYSDDDIDDCSLYTESSPSSIFAKTNGRGRGTRGKVSRGRARGAPKV